MNDNVIKVHQDPFSLSFSLDTQRLATGGLGIHGQFFGH